MVQDVSAGTGAAVVASPIATHVAARTNAVTDVPARVT